MLNSSLLEKFCLRKAQNYLKTRLTAILIYIY
jgi:hypothetical protein